MITLRRAADRGTTTLDWLDSRHSFSFGHYHDPGHMGFRALRVINDDRVAPGGGFAPHGHRDMEILTYVLDGALAHRDSLGTGSTIERGDVQIMSAGTGIRHSEYNASSSAPVHFLQIWIPPERPGLAPRYEQRRIDVAARPGRLLRIAGREPSGEAVQIFQDVVIHAGALREGDEARLSLRPGRHAWVQLARGSALLGEHRLDAGDGAALSEEDAVVLRATGEAEALVFDLA